MNTSGLIGRDEPTRHFWASTAPPPERLTLWRGNGGVDWEREYVPAEQLRGAEELAAGLVDVDPDFSAMLPAQRDRYAEDVRRLATAVLAVVGAKP